MHRTHFSEELPPKPSEYPIHLDQDSPKPAHVFRIVGGVRGVLFEWDSIGYFDRHGPDPGFQPESVETGHNLGVEIRDGPRSEQDRFGFTFVCLQYQGVIDEIEVDLKTRAAIGDRRSRQPATGHIK